MKSLFPSGRSRGVTVVVDGFFAFGAGAGILGGTGHERWIPVLICFGVGAHFFPLASTLRNPSLRPLGGLLIAVAAAALGAGLASAVAPSSVTGPGAGLCLLGFGLATLLINSRTPVGPDAAG